MEINGDIFFELFLGDLDKEKISADYKRERNKKHKRDSGSANRLFKVLGLRHGQVKKVYF